MAKPKLNDAHREFLVVSIACYQTPTEVVKAIQERFGVEIRPQTVETYDPTKTKLVRKRWRDLFAVSRERYLKDVSDIPIAHRGGRLQELQRALNVARKHGNVTLVKDICETAARECGDAYTNRRQLEHEAKEGGALAQLLKRVGGSTLPVARAAAEDG